MSIIPAGLANALWGGPVCLPSVSDRVYKRCG
jgi:hypothetical protein